MFSPILKKNKVEAMSKKHFSKLNNIKSILNEAWKTDLKCL